VGMGMRVGDGTGGGMREGRGGMEEERERPWALLDCCGGACWIGAVSFCLGLSAVCRRCLLLLLQVLLLPTAGRGSWTARGMRSCVGPAREEGPEGG